MGTIEVGSTKAGKRRRKTVTGKSEAEVKDRVDRKQRELGLGKPPPINERTTMKTFAAKWLDITEKEVTPNAHTTDRAATGWIIEAIGHRRLDEVNGDDVRAVRNAITKAGRSTSTALRYHRTLMLMLKFAEREGHIIPRSAMGAKPPVAAINDRTAMTPEEAILLLEQASRLDHGSRWLCAFLQGSRQGETLGLTDPNTVDGRLRLAWQLQPLPYSLTRDRTSGFRVPDGYEHVQLEGRLHLVRPKSKAGWRVAPLVPMMADALDHWRTIRAESPHGLVWPTENGRPRDETADRDEFRVMQDAAGVRHPSGRHYHVHEARHTTATLLLSLGVDEATRIAIMGHSSYASTLTYEHVDLTQIRRALQKVAKRLQLT